MKTLKFHLTIGLVAATTFFSCNNSDNILNNIEQVKRINGAIEYPFIKDDKKEDDEWFFE